jgi:hypothetical protein
MHSYEALDRSGGFARRGLLEPFKNRDFRLLWTGMAVSLTGDGILLVALAWQAYSLSNVPTAFSIVGLALSLPHIALLLVGGVVSDRFPRRRVMLAADVVRGIAVAAMAVLALTGRLELIHLAALAAVYGAGMAFFGPAFDAIVVDVVPEDLFPQANSLDQLVKPLALRMIGPAAGGWIIGAWGPGAAFLVDAGTFAVSAACLYWMSAGGRGPAGVGLGSLTSELAAGFAFVRSRVWLWGTFGAAALAYLLFMGPAEALVPFVVKNELGGDATDLGLVFAIGGAGSICAAVAFGRWGVPKRPITFMYIAWTLATLAVAGYGLAGTIWQLVAASVCFHALETAGTIAWMTLKQKLIPGALLGRVSSLDWLISTALLPLSFALAGPVAVAIGARTTLVVAGLVGAVITFAALFLPGMRLPEEPTGAGRTREPRSGKPAPDRETATLM